MIDAIFEQSAQETYTIPFTGNRYCGPAALAYVLRSDPGTAATILREVSGKKKIIGVNGTHLVKAIERSGLKVAQRSATYPFPNAKAPRLRYPTLQYWVEDVKPFFSQEFVINVTGHYLVIHRGKYFDNGCHLGKPIALCPYLRCRVKMAWLIERTGPI